MASSIVTIASADESNGGYNTSNTDTVTAPYTGGEAHGDAANMQSIQDQTESMKDGVGMANVRQWKMETNK